MRIPNFIDSKFVDDDGSLTDTWRNILSQLFIELQKNTSVEGLVTPSQSLANITELEGKVPDGSFLYDTDTGAIKVSIGGEFKTLQTTAGAPLSPNLSVVTDVSGNLVNGSSSATEINYLNNVTSDVQAQLNAKEPTITAGTNLQYYRGDKSWQTLNTAAVTELTNLYYTDTRARSSISSSATGLTYTTATGVFSLTPGYVIPTTTQESNWNDAYSKRVDTWTTPLQFSSNTASITQSSASANGYLSSADWNTFYNKEPAITAGTTSQYWRGDKSWQALDATSVGLGNVTNDVQTKAAIVPNTAPASGQILVGNAGGTAYAPQTMSTDVTLTSAGVATIANNVVTNAKLAQAGAQTYKGNNTAVLANVSDIATNTAFNQSFETLTANIKPNGTVNVGALSTVPRADHIHAFSATQPLIYNGTTGNISLGSRSIFISAETNGNYNNYRTRNIGAAGNFNFNFSVPMDFYSLVACYVQGFVSAGAAGANKNIDISVGYNSGSGQLYNQFTASDTTTLYNLTGLTNRLFNLPVTALFTSLVAGSVGGINVKHTTLGGSIDYIGVLLVYV